MQSTQSVSQKHYFNAKELDKLVNLLDTLFSSEDDTAQADELQSGDGLAIIATQIRESFLDFIKQDPSISQAELSNIIKNLILLHHLINEEMDLIPLLSELENIFINRISFMVMTKESFDQLSKKAKNAITKPHLLKDANNQFHFLGYQEQKWQLTAINHTVLSDLQWDFEKTHSEFVNPDHPLTPLFHTLHTQTLNNKNLKALTEALAESLNMLFEKNLEFNSGTHESLSEEVSIQANLMQSFLYQLQGQLFSLLARMKDRTATSKALCASPNYLIRLNSPLRHQHDDEVSHFTDRMASFCDGQPLIIAFNQIILAIATKPTDLTAAIKSCHKIADEYISSSKDSINHDMIKILHELIQKYFHETIIDHSYFTKTTAEQQATLLNDCQSYIELCEVLSKKIALPSNAFFTHSILQLCSKYKDLNIDMFNARNPFWHVLKSTLSLIPQSDFYSGYHIQMIVTIAAYLKADLRKTLATSSESNYSALYNKLKSLYELCLSDIKNIDKIFDKKDTPVSQHIQHYSTYRIFSCISYLIGDFEALGQHKRTEYVYSYLYSVYCFTKLYPYTTQNEVEIKRLQMDYIYFYNNYRDNIQGDNFYQSLKRINLHKVSKSDFVELATHIKERHQTTTKCLAFMNEQGVSNLEMNEIPTLGNKLKNNPQIEDYASYFDARLKGIQFIEKMIRDIPNTLLALPSLANSYQEHFKTYIRALSSLEDNIYLKNIKPVEVNEVLFIHSTNIIKTVLSQSYFEISNIQPYLHFLYVICANSANNIHDQIDSLIKATEFFTNNKPAADHNTDDLAIHNRTRFMQAAQTTIDSINSSFNFTDESYAKCDEIIKKVEKLSTFLKKLPAIELQPFNRYINARTELDSTKETAIRLHTYFNESLATFRNHCQTVTDRKKADTLDKKQKENQERLNRIKEKQKKLESAQPKAPSSDAEPKSTIISTSTSTTSIVDIIEAPSQQVASEKVSLTTAKHKPPKHNRKPPLKKNKNKKNDKKAANKLNTKKESLIVSDEEISSAEEEDTTNITRSKTPPIDSVAIVQTAQIDTQAQMTLPINDTDDHAEVSIPAIDIASDLDEENPSDQAHEQIEKQQSDGDLHSTQNQLSDHDVDASQMESLYPFTTMDTMTRLGEILFPYDSLEYFRELANRFGLIGTGSAWTLLLKQALKEKLGSTTDVSTLVKDVDFYLPYSDETTDRAITYFSDKANGWEMDANTFFCLNFSRLLYNTKHQVYMKFEVAVRLYGYYTFKLMNLTDLEARFKSPDNMIKSDNYHYLSTPDADCLIELFDKDRSCVTSLETGVIDFKKLDLGAPNIVFILKHVRGLFFCIAKEINLAINRLFFELINNHLPIGPVIQEMITFDWAYKYFRLQSHYNANQEIVALIKNNIFDAPIFTDVIQAFLQNEILKQLSDIYPDAEWREDELRYSFLPRIYQDFINYFSTRYTATQKASIPGREWNSHISAFISRHAHALCMPHPHTRVAPVTVFMQLPIPSPSNMQMPHMMDAQPTMHSPHREAMQAPPQSTDTKPVRQYHLKQYRHDAKERRNTSAEPNSSSNSATSNVTKSQASSASVDNAKNLASLASLDITKGKIAFGLFNQANSINLQRKAGNKPVHEVKPNQTEEVDPIAATSLSGKPMMPLKKNK